MITRDADERNSEITKLEILLHPFTFKKIVYEINICKAGDEFAQIIEQ
jgi:hypothetical protein